MADLALGKVRIADLTNVIAGPVSTRVWLNSVLK